MNISRLHSGIPRAVTGSTHSRIYLRSTAPDRRRESLFNSISQMPIKPIANKNLLQIRSISSSITGLTTFAQPYEADKLATPEPHRLQAFAPTAHTQKDNNTWPNQARQTPLVPRPPAPALLLADNAPAVPRGFARKLFCARAMDSQWAEPPTRDGREASITPEIALVTEAF